jgi:hypothetical protein
MELGLDDKQIVTYKSVEAPCKWLSVGYMARQKNSMVQPTRASALPHRMIAVDTLELFDIYLHT